MALNNRYDEMYRYQMDYAPTRPHKPSLRKITRFKRVDQSRSCKGKNVESLNAAADKILEARPKLTLKDIKVHTYYGGTDLRWTEPESDADFEKRKKLAQDCYDREVKEYDKALKDYNKYMEQKSLKKIKGAVSDHEAAVNTIAEVLKKYPDVLEKAVAKAMK